MDYKFDEKKFIESFNAKSIEVKSADSFRLTHKADNQFKLFPFKASGKTQSPIITDLEEVVSSFFREALKEQTEKIDYEELCEDMLKEINIDKEDIEFFKDLIQSLFFVKDNFVANNFALYQYQSSENNKSVDNLAKFLFSIFGINENDRVYIEKVKEKYNYNVLEKLVIKTIEEKKVSDVDGKNFYFRVKIDVEEKFRKDFYFMLESGMTSLEDFSNLFSVYYFYYMSQTCIILDHFCSGKRNDEVKFYYALDWEKVSRNRKCCEEGWGKLQGSISHMFSHAITLEILNQTLDEEMYDYIAFGEEARSSNDKDMRMADEVKKAEEIYCSYVGDYKKFDNIKLQNGESKTDEAIKHLYKCVETQFLETERKRANQFYNEKFSEFCKIRWVKNRKKSGLVLNLTERDIIFLTKICIRNLNKIRLNDLYKEYEYRGIYLDNTSKEYLQEFFTKLNLIDKKSDSGDAQYVKRIL